MRYHNTSTKLTFKDARRAQVAGGTQAGWAPLSPGMCQTLGHCGTGTAGWGPLLPGPAVGQWGAAVLGITCFCIHFFFIISKQLGGHGLSAGLKHGAARRGCLLSNAVSIVFKSLRVIIPKDKEINRNKYHLCYSHVPSLKWTSKAHCTPF